MCSAGMVVKAELFKLGGICGSTEIEIKEQLVLLFTNKLGNSRFLTLWFS